MTTSSILIILFLAELVIVGCALSVYLYWQLKRLKDRLRNKASGSATGQGTSPLHDLFELQITRTRKRIAQQENDLSAVDTTSHKALLHQRIEYLQLEKELLDDEENNNFWVKLYTRLTAILNPRPADHEATANADEATETSSLRRRLSRYKAILTKVITEFREYRKHSRRLTTTIVSQNPEVSTDKQLAGLLADHDVQDGQYGQRLDAYELEGQQLDHDEAPAAATSPPSDYAPHKTSEEEIARLRQIITRQYSSLDELKDALTHSGASEEQTQELASKLHAVERSQKELQTCVEVLELENHRLSEDISAMSTRSSHEITRLKNLNTDLEQQLDEANNKFMALEVEHHALQAEFVRLYAGSKRPA